MALTRLPFWDTRSYNAFLIAHATTPFEWAKNDCCIFAANGILAFTNVDIAADFRGVYTDMVGAFKAIKKIAKGTTVEDAAAYCAAKAGMEELVHPLMAQRGDLVIINNEETLIAGLVHLNGRDVISVSENGLVRLPLANVTRAWRV